MKLEWLTYAVEIAETGSFSQAAKNLYIAQPNLSRAIRQLEDELGYSVFTRSSDGAVPTPLGLEFMEHARMVCSECRQILNTRDKTRSVRRQRLGFACIHARNTAFLPMIYQKYVDSPINSICLDGTGLDELIRLVVSVQIDIAFIETLSAFVDSVKAQLHNSDIEYHPYATAKIYAAIGPRSPLYQEKGILVKDLYPHTIVSHANINHDNTCNYAMALGLENHVRGSVKTNSTTLFYQLIHESSAIGLIATPPKNFYRLCQYRDIRLVELCDCETTVELAWMKLRRLPLSDLAMECLEYNLELIGS